MRLLRNMHESKNTLLSMPNSPTTLECPQELFILLWKTLKENLLFLNFILTRYDVRELVTPICNLMNVLRKDVAQVGLIHICTFILLKLSGERSFGVGLHLNRRIAPNSRATCRAVFGEPHRPDQHHAA